MEKQFKWLATVAYLCQGLATIGAVVWLINALIFFFGIFSEGFQLGRLRDMFMNYGGTLIATIVTIMLLYACGGVMYLLLEIEKNTRKGA